MTRNVVVEKIMKPLSGELSAEDASGSVVLVTSDSKKYIAPRDVMSASLLVREVIEDADGGVVEIPLVAVDSRTLLVIWEFVEHHHTSKSFRDLERPLKGELKSLLDPWDWQYVESSLLSKSSSGPAVFNTLFAVLNASSFLNIPQLRDLCSAVVANAFRNKTEEEILAMCGVGEFTKKDEEYLFEDFPWLREMNN